MTVPGWRSPEARLRLDRLSGWAALVALVAGGLALGYGGAPAACRPTIPGSLFGLHLDLVPEPTCVLGLADAGFATAHAGPLAWTLCLGVVWLGLLSVGGLTGVGLALRGLLRRVRDWFIRHTTITPRPTDIVEVLPTRVSGMFRLPDLRSAIVARPSLRRGPPVLLPC